MLADPAVQFVSCLVLLARDCRNDVFRIWFFLEPLKIQNTKKIRWCPPYFLFFIFLQKIFITMLFLVWIHEIYSYIGAIIIDAKLILLDANINDIGIWRVRVGRLVTSTSGVYELGGGWCRDHWRRPLFLRNSCLKSNKKGSRSYLPHRARRRRNEPKYTKLALAASEAGTTILLWPETDPADGSRAPYRFGSHKELHCSILIRSSTAASSNLRCI